MTKSIYIFSLLSFAFIQYAPAREATTDTAFIWKDSVNGASQSIFFESNKNSEYYAYITNFNFRQFDKESYNYSLNYLKENNLILTKKKTVMPSAKWSSLHLYKGKLCVYSPCDFYNFYQISINDSTYIDWTGEGPCANKIIDQKKISNTVYELITAGVYNVRRKITVHIIDQKKGIAVFEELTDGKAKRHYLMIMTSKIKSVPFIVNYCGNEKQNELEFDEPEYKNLLNQK